jgi:hypothetical protein
MSDVKLNMDRCGRRRTWKDSDTREYGQSMDTYLSLHLSEWVSEWLLFNANSAIFQLYHDENKLIFIEMMMRSSLF